MSLRRLVRSVLNRCGFELSHATDDPVLNEARRIVERLRLCPGDEIAWADQLPLPASHASIRSMLRLHQIDLVLDVGANRGQFARLVRQLGYTGDIVSFEPQSHCRIELETAAQSDPRWTVVPCAVGNAPAELDLHVYADDTFSSLYQANDTAQRRFGSLVSTRQVERVRVIRLDDWWAEFAAGPARRILLKTDTQGNDLAVLDGTTEVLRQTHAIIVEASYVPIYQGTPQFAELAAWATSQGFVPSGIFPISHDSANLALIEADCVFTRARAPQTDDPL